MHYLTTSFLKANADCYWHYVVKNCHEASTYSREKVDKQIAHLQAKSGQPNSFEEKKEKGWTPLHVALLAGNKEGLIFLRTMGVSLNVRDDAGKTAEDYAIELKRADLLQILQASDLAVCLRHVLQKWAVTLPQAPFCYQQDTHDFGVEIKELFFSCPTADLQVPKTNILDSGARIDHFAKNIRQVAAYEGFGLRFSTKQYIVRDSFLMLGDGTHALSNQPEDLKQHLERVESLALVTQSKAIYQCPHLSFFAAIGAAKDFKYYAWQEHKELFPDEGKQISFYLEGGNYWLATNTKGKKMLLIGEDHLYCTLNQFREVIKHAPYPKVDPSKDDHERYLHEMHAQGLLADIPGVGFGLISNVDASELVLQVLRNPEYHRDIENPCYKLALSAGKFRPIHLTKDIVQKTKASVVQYVTQKECIKQFMAHTFGLEIEQLVIIQQLFYHLDIFIKPGPKGAFFVQNFEMSLEILKKIAEKKDLLKLTKNDLEMLNHYIQTSETLAKKLKQSLDAIVEQLKEAGFLVIPTPGLFFDTSPQIDADALQANLKNSNFLNAVSGWSPKTNSFYYIATGAQVGDKLGSLLMQMYRQFLQTYLPAIHLYYIGYNPENPTDFSEGMQFTSRWDLQAGVHCLSNELKTASHVG